VVVAEWLEQFLLVLKVPGSKHIFLSGHPTVNGTQLFSELWKVPVALESSGAPLLPVQVGSLKASSPHIHWLRDNNYF